MMDASTPTGHSTSSYCHHLWLCAVLVTFGALDWGCSASSSGNELGESASTGTLSPGMSGSGSGGQGGSGIGFNPETENCVNLECQQVECDGGVTTVLTGTVVAPTPPQFGAADPVYNVRVYVPNAEVSPFTDGVVCDQCGTPVSGSPLVQTLSDASGSFTLENVPAGTDIPLVLQIGRWRRQLVIPEVPECVTTALDTDFTRLPRSSQEGDIPRIAIVTASYDPEECILRKIGIDDSEFTGSLGTGRIHLFKGQGADISNTEDASALYGSLSKLMEYDVVLLPCSTPPPDEAAKQNIFDYANAGGRVFATDLSYAWVTEGPSPFPDTAQYEGWGSLGANPLPAFVDQTFPKGEALAQWLQHVGATTTLGSIGLNQTYFLLKNVNPPTTRWLYSESPNASVQTLSFNTPVGVEVESQCGRVVYSNFHIASSTGGFGTFPAECGSDAEMTAQEKVLEFLLFDLASCIQDDGEEPVPPPK